MYLNIKVIFHYLGDLIELLWILTRKNHTIMLVKHIPLYLSSYNATLDRSDQFLLKVIRIQEFNFQDIILSPIPFYLRFFSIMKVME
jgi:hypothetical protein